MPSRNALRLQKQSIHSFRLWRPKPNGASGCSGTERYFRADMLGPPLQLVTISLMAQAVGFIR